jgi:MFS family permease
VAEKMIISDKPEGGKSSPFFSAQFIIILFISFFIYCSSQMLTLTLPKYASNMGAVPEAVGFLTGIYAMCALLMRPISGQIVDTENKKKTLCIVLCTTLAAILGFVLSKNYWLLIVFRCLNGLAWGVGSTLCMTIATGCFTEKNMAAGVGIYGLGQTLAQTIAPIFALPIADTFGYNVLYLGNIALILISLVLTCFIKVKDSPSDSEPQKRRYSFSLNNMIHVPAILPASLTFCNTMAKAAIFTFLVIFGESLHVGNIGLFFTIQAATIFVCRPFLSKMADKFGLLKLLIPCEILVVSGLAVIASAHTLPVFLVAAVMMGISVAGEQPILMAECVKSAGPSKRGKASNTSYVGTDIGQFIGSNLSGVLVAWFGYRRMYLTIALPIIICTAAFFILFRRRASIVS